MRLIIDIPEDVYNYIMKLNLCNMAEEYIKNGIPFNKIMDEIDAQIDIHDTSFEIDDGIDSSFCDGLNKAKEIIDKYREEQG